MPHRLIQTVLGKIAPENAGYTQCHEHICLAEGRSFEINPALRMDDYSRSAEELRLYRSSGGCSIVDAQPVYCGRMAESLAALSRETGVHIVSVTGFHKMIFYREDNPIKNLSSEELTSLFCSEITDGMLNDQHERFPSRAGVIKGALEPGFRTAHPSYPALFDAIAQTAVQTGAPLMLHTDEGSDPLAALDFFELFGIAPERIMLCHLDRTSRDPDIHRRVLDRGAYLCYDSVRRLKYLSHEEEIKLIKTMLNEGYRDQIVLSLDTTNQRLSSYGGDMGLDYILKKFSVKLVNSGIDPDILTYINTHNSAKWLSFSDQQRITNNSNPLEVSHEI